MGLRIRKVLESPDNRLNYDKFLVEGKEILSKSIEYTSHNTKRLDIEEIIEIL